MLETTAGAARAPRRPALRLARQACLPLRLETIAARRASSRIPFTSGILIGIGETREERLDALLALRDLARAARPPAGGDRAELPRQAGHADGRHPEPPLDELLWTIAAARAPARPAMHVQAPPNLAYDEFPRLLDAGIDDWGGVSPVTIDHVNPEAPWPELERLERGDAQPRARARAAAAASTPSTSDLGAGSTAASLPTRPAPSDAAGLAREDELVAGRDHAGAVRRPPRRAAGRAHRRRARRGRARRASSAPAARSASGLRRGRPAAARGRAATRSPTS